jgi:HD-GYP domain-containing protein (c-di-GMP phosphodiesterase class II)/cell division protein FtsN
MVEFRNLTKSGEEKKRSAALSEKPGRSNESESKFSQLGLGSETTMPGGFDDASEFSAEDMASIYQEASDFLDKVFASVRKKETFDIAAGVEVVRKMVEIPSHENALFIQAIQTDDKIAFLANKSINVAIYAIRIGQQLGFEKRKLKEMGLAALLHEVGMCAIPEEILYKDGKLTEDEFQIVKQHSELGFDLLSVHNGNYGFLADVVLQAHERRDGSGYPAGLTEEEIHEYAQIIGLVDSYEAISHSRPQREKFSHFHTIKEIIKTGKKKFQRNHLKALLNSFSIFPLSSHVRLNSKAIGRVIEIHSDQPLRPKIQIVLDSQGRPVHSKRIVNLKENSLLHITDAVFEEELKNLSEKSVGTPKKPQVPIPKVEDDLSSEPVGASEDLTPSPIRNTGDKSGAGALLRSKRFLLGVIFILALGIPVVMILLNDMGRPKTDEAAVSGLQIGEKIETATHPEESQGVSKQDPGQAVDKGQTGGTSSSFEVKKPAETGNDAESIETQSPILTEPTLSAQAQVAEESYAPSDSAVVAEADDTGVEKRPDDLQGVRIAPEIEAVRPSFPYAILVGSFRQRDRAEEDTRFLRDKGIISYWTKVDLEENGIWYRVFAGYYKEDTQAEKAAGEYRLTGAKIKKTAYAALVGTYLSDAALSDQKAKLEILGYSPYVINGIAGEKYLFVGAFFTQKGAEDQSAELASNGIDSMVVPR